MNKEKVVNVVETGCFNCCNLNSLQALPIGPREGIPRIPVSARVLVSRVDELWSSVSCFIVGHVVTGKNYYYVTTGAQ